MCDSAEQCPSMPRELAAMVAAAFLDPGTSNIRPIYRLKPTAAAAAAVALVFDLSLAQPD